MLPIYDVIVVGAGHAGCEAAAAAANMGSKTLLITMDMTKMGQMSCNPAMGGIAKGQILREIDALGGMSGIITDKTTIQFRMLNRSKGPAMWSPRAQCDRKLFSSEWRIALENLPNLDFWQDSVNDLIIENNEVRGVNTTMGCKFNAKTVILTNGTFLNGMIHIGKNQQKGGRASEPDSTGLTEQLRSIGFETGRMKTGTPARIDGRSINFKILQEQPGDEIQSKFSFLSEIQPNNKQIPCYITYTNENVHEILTTGFKDSPLFDGTIQGIGPRYCPSIETKIVTFKDKTQHQLFLEPEGWDTNEYYVNGFSSSLPWEVQYQAIRNIKGLENAKLFRPGYAIEYDFFAPIQLHHTLETKIINNLFLAGQINGTTGYEEAAAQGLIAGINAHLKHSQKQSFTLQRNEAYIGVLIDDLTTKGVDEPYRMFTSRSEFRILLRQDNADQRLTEKGYSIGLASQKRFNEYKNKEAKINQITSSLNNITIKPNQINESLTKINSANISQGIKLSTLLLRPEIDLEFITQNCTEFSDKIITNEANTEIKEQCEILIKYKTYIEREYEQAQKFSKLENLKIPQNYNYMILNSLSTEARQKLQKQTPKTIGEASRISGVSPSDINILLTQFNR